MHFCFIRKIVKVRFFLPQPRGFSLISKTLVSKTKNICAILITFANL
nr:MAG TPA: hypothetical protein [Caudoviricetes sp.]